MYLGRRGLVLKARIRLEESFELPFDVQPLPLRRGHGVHPGPREEAGFWTETRGSAQGGGACGPAAWRDGQGQE